MAYNKIGFHVSQPGNLNGLGDYVRALDAAGIPAVLMGVGGSVGDIIGCWERGSTVPHIAAVRYMPVDGSQDVPPYGSNPRQAAVAWWGWLYPRIGSDVKAHRDKCWIVTGNELRKEESDWLGRFYVELATIMHSEGFKLCAFNFAPGEPEPEHWTTPGMLAYLELCANRPYDTAVGLHEYALGDNLQAAYPHLIGRFEALHQVCDSRGIRRPSILITEWGWRQESVPPVDVAMAQLPFAAGLYAQHPNILGAGIWTLQNWHSGCIPNCVQALIAPIRDYTLTAVFPDPQPTLCPGAAREPYNRVYWVVQPNNPNAEAIYAQAAAEGRTVGPSLDDACLGVGLSSKLAVVWDIPASRHQEFINWVAAEYPGTAVQFRYSDGTPATTPVNTPPSSDPCAAAVARVPYHRVYWVAANEATRSAVYAMASQERRTVGPSFDDAGIGAGLSSKTAVLFDKPANEHQSFRDFFAAYYPGTAVEFRESSTPPPTPAGGFDAPVGWGGNQSGDVWPAHYFDANPIGTSYSQGRHTGADLNDNTTAGWDSDRLAPAFAIADGVVTQAGVLGGTWGNVVVIDHGPVAPFNKICSRYGHLHDFTVTVGQQVAKGQQIGRIGNAFGQLAYHLHFDISPGNRLITSPGDWPGTDFGRVVRHYLEPRSFIRLSRPGMVWPEPRTGVVSSPVNFRTGPASSFPVYSTLAVNTAVVVLNELDSYYLVRLAGGEHGWCHINYISLNPPPQPGYQYNGPAVTFAPMIHAPADDWRWPTVNSMIAGLGIGVKFLSHGVNADFVGQYAGKKRICRLFWNNPAGDSVKTAQQKWNMDWASDFGRMYNAGIRHFEIHNEPRLASEGFGRQWGSAAEWGNWLSQMVDIIKAQYPQAKLYYPGESPGLPWSDQFAFTNVAWPMVRGKMDGFCLHAYSGASVFNTAVEEIVGQVLEAQAYLNLQVPLIVSESSVNRGVDYWMKANVYVEVEKRLNGVPGIEGVAWFVSDWESPPPEQAQHGEVWYGKPIVGYYLQLK